MSNPSMAMSFRVVPPGWPVGTPAMPPPRATGGHDARTLDAAEQFEALFVAQILRAMRNAIREINPAGSIFRDRAGSDMTDLADGQVARLLASRHAFGIADFILRQLPPDAGTAASAQA
ncbi:rod-binding protein [Burkholderia sp. RF2-non_BP3]|uniref:rod-binding protein n=1 Tax=Burkholderia sp. RF2-non_BP3 TaxID=1637844 RepID=UPI000AF550C6|nr:rod-binding protein [Burkholderia sp. RF2-non_BP3]